MNCHRDDLAYIVSPDFPPYDRKFVTCVQGPFTHPDFGACWVVHPEGWTPPLWTVKLVQGLFAYPDAHLRPIRPQADDAVDEVLIRVGLPTDGVLV
jgi:hypothetical protein